jgi:hypothetical protein
MDPSQILEIISFIEGKKEPSLVVESSQHAKPLANVLFESYKLYSMLKESNDLDKIVEQISKKNKSAKEYFRSTGKKWLF